MNTFAKTIAGVSLLVAVGVPGAHAGLLAVGATSERFTVTYAEEPVPLTRDGAKSITFTTTRANTFVVVTYNAQCSVGGKGWLSTIILVDGVAADPGRDADFVLCTAIDQTLLVAAAASHQAVIGVRKAGQHTVRVLAITLSADGSLTRGHLDFGSIVVKN